jgi:hypothetical protein
VPGPARLAYMFAVPSTAPSRTATVVRPTGQIARACYSVIVGS